MCQIPRRKDIMSQQILRDTTFTFNNWKIGNYHQHIRSIYMYVCIYVCVYIYIYVCVCIYIYIERERGSLGIDKMAGLGCELFVVICLQNCTIISKQCMVELRDGSEDKESARNAADPGSIPGSGSSPGEGNGYPLQYSCLENSMARRAWWATVHGVAKSWAQLSD